MKKFIIKSLIISLSALIFPYITTLFMTGNSERVKHIDTGELKIIVSDDKSIEEIDLESYIIGVVAAQMPADNEVEALKAQAVIARTRALKTIETIKEKEINAKDLSQEYLSISALKELWGYDAYASFLPKLENAIYATKGEVMEYEDQLIEAVYHSLSVGKTRSAQEAWGHNIAYLSSVDSSYDTKANDNMKITVSAVSEILDLISKADDLEEINLSEDNFFESIQVIERDSLGYIKLIQIGNKDYTGEELEKILGLNSSCMYIENYEKNVRIICKGIGHGVGMSQYGANIMAKEGHDYKEILKHYYSGVEIIKK